MWRHLRTISIVAVISGLIWLFAEAESLRTQEQQVELVMESPEGGGRLLEFADPLRPGQGPRRWVVTLEGATGAVDEFARALRNPVRIYPGLEGVPIESGVTDVDLKTVLLAHPDLNPSRRGVSISRVEPATLRLRIEELVTLTMKVEVRAPARGEFDGVPETRPPTVAVTLPRAEADRLADMAPPGEATPGVAGAPAIAAIDQATFDRLVPGRKETVAGVPVRLPSDIPASRIVRIDPPAVDVSLTVRRGTISVRIPSVPVHLRIALTEYGKWDISVPEPFLSDVTVTGPRDLVKQVEDKTIPLIAYLPLSYEELERGLTSKEAVFSDLPPELYPLRFEAASRVVRFEVRRRPPGDSPPPP